jgi:hypothetical protein
MAFRFAAPFLIASLCGAQTPATIQPAASQSAPSGSITVPPGTSIALTLVSSIKSKSTKPGDAVRAVVAFPVTVGTQIAIPAGTYVQGVVNEVNPRPPQHVGPSVKLHFTQLLYANGYAAPLDAMNTEAMAILPDAAPRAIAELADARDGAPSLGVDSAEGFEGEGQTAPPPLPPLPSAGPSPGVVVGASIGGTVGVLALVLALNHHRIANTDYLLFDNGWQFEIALSTPLTVDAAKVAAAAAMPAAQ